MVLFHLMTFCYVMFVVEAKDVFHTVNDKSHVETIANKIITERLQYLEEKMMEKFDSKLKDIMGKQYLERMRILEETILKQQSEMAVLKEMEEVFHVQRQEIADLKSKCKNYGRDTFPIIQDPPVDSMKTIENNKTFPAHDEDPKEEVYSAKKGPDRINQEQEAGMNRATRLLLGTVQSPTETSVAFYAYLSKQETNTGPHHTLIFDHVETNIGNSYNQHTGVFTAPISGIYLFTYTIFAENHGYNSVEIVVNSVSRGAIFVDNSSPSHSSYTGTTGVAVLVLNQGDDGFIRTHSTYHSVGIIRSDNLMRTAFSGVKI